MQLLPHYAPPDARPAALAAGIAPLVVLVVFTLVVLRWLEPSAGFAVLGSVTLWLAWEMHLFQRRIDAYNRRYAEQHLVWRSSEALLALVAGDDAHPPTQRFVRGFVAAGRRVRRDGQIG